MTEEAELVKSVLNDAHSLELFRLSLPGASKKRVESAVRAWAHGYLQRQSDASRPAGTAGKAVTRVKGYTAVSRSKSDAPEL